MTECVDPIPPAPAARESAFLTYDSAAALLEVSVSTLERMHKAGQMPAPVKLRGRVIRFDRDTLLEWLRTPGPNGEPMNRAQWSAYRAGGITRRKTK